MKIRIQKVSGGMYSAELISLPSNFPSEKPEWTTPAPMHAQDLCRVLLARGLDPSDISDAFEEADPVLSTRLRKHCPTVGEEVLVENHLGTFIVEEVDAVMETASLRVLRSGILLKGVEWRTIGPLDNKLSARLGDIFNSEELQQLISRRISRNIPRE